MKEVFHLEMTYENKIRISDSEWEVMRVIWTLGSATAQEILNALGNTMDWKTAKVKTLLRRLVDKQALETRKNGKKFIYTPLISEEHTIDVVTEDLFSKICAKKVGTTIADIVQQYELTQEDIDLIQQQLTEKSPATIIQCNCLPDQCNC